MPGRLTIYDIAKKAGIHYSTVSLALKNDSRISVKTREMVTRIAKELGYMPDPMLSALSAYRRFNKPAQFHGTIAWVCDYPPRPRNVPCHCFDLYFAGASERAVQYGYRLEEFCLRELGMNHQKASKVLVNRGVHGLLLSPSAISQTQFDMDWDNFSVVKFGYTVTEPRAHLVTAAHYRAMVTIIEKLTAQGFTRIGYVSIPNFERRVDRNFKAAFLSADSGLPEGETIPILSNEKLTKPMFFDWFKKYRPQAIITANGEIPDWLREKGLHVPDDIRIAFPILQDIPTGESHAGLCGIVEASRTIGSTAVDLLSTMLLHGERGIPANPLRMLVEGTWVDFPAEIPVSEKGDSLALMRPFSTA